MKYKVNDRVRVREDLKVDNCYQDFYFTSAMKKFKGKNVTITKVKLDCYKIKEDDGEWNWSESMFEDTKPFTKFDLKDGDILIRRSGERTYFDKESDLETLTEDLLNTGAMGESWDVIKVERPVKFETVFERKEEPKEMTLKEICEKLGYEVKIVKEQV